MTDRDSNGETLDTKEGDVPGHGVSDNRRPEEVPVGRGTNRENSDARPSV